MATGVLLSLLTSKTELVARGVYGAGKTQCIALLAAYFALRRHYVYYAPRENTTITAMLLSCFVSCREPRKTPPRWPFGSSQVPSRVAYLCQHSKHRPLAKAVDHAKIFIYDEAQQEAALSDIAIVGALPRKCLFLRLGDLRRRQAARSLSASSKKFVPCVMGFPLASARRVSPCCRRRTTH